MTCPRCRKPVGPEHFHCNTAARGGRAGTGKVKARTTAQARKAGLASANKRAKTRARKGRK